LEQWTQAAPKSALAWAVYAQLETQAGNQERGRELLAKAVEMERDATMKERYREMLSRLDSGPPAKTLSKPQGTLDPAEVTAALKEASDDIWEGHDEDAIETLEDLMPLLQGRPELDEALLLMGTALCNAGETTRARNIWKPFCGSHLCPFPPSVKASCSRSPR
jgi:thioredoxin-like negative regulator of GroEL